MYVLQLHLVRAGPTSCLAAVLTNRPGVIVICNSDCNSNDYILEVIVIVIVFSKLCVIVIVIQ